MDVGVDEAGGDQRIAVVLYLDTGQFRQQLGGSANLGDLAILDQQDAVLEVLIGLFHADHGRVGQAVQDGGAVGFDGIAHRSNLMG